MTLLAEYTLSIYADVDARRLIEEFPVEWRDFLGDDLWDERTELEFVRETADELGREFFDGPWCRNRDANVETYVR